MKSNIKKVEVDTIIFDFDGTLHRGEVLSLPIFHECLHSLYEKYDIPQNFPSDETILSQFGEQTEDIYPSLLKTNDPEIILTFGKCVEEAEGYNQYYCAGYYDSEGWFFKCYLDNNPPDCELINPKNGLYLRGTKILTMTDLTVTIGDAIIEIETEDVDSGIEKIEIYINDALEHTTYSPSSTYEWLWDETTPGLYTIKVIAYDNAGYNMEDEVRLLDIF